MGFCSLRVVAQPLVEPISVAEAALHLRIDAPAPDLPAYIAAARAWAEGYLNRALITQTLRFTISPAQPLAAPGVAPINPIIFAVPLNWWPVAGASIHLPMSPVQAIQGVTQHSQDGTQVTLDPDTDFFADITNDPGKLTLRNIGQPIGSDLSVTYVAGYGDTSDDVPQTIKQAIRMLTAHFYEHRGDEDSSEPPSAVKMLLGMERMVSFA